MYKVEIEIGDWSWDEDQKVTIESGDFDKIQIIQEFIEFQKDHGWAADYDVVEYDDEEEDAQCDEEVEDEEDEEVEYQVGDIVEDEDGLVWELVG
jgi:hypothetical protein